MLALIDESKKIGKVKDLKSEIFWKTFNLSLKSSNPKIVATALDGIHRLIAYGYFTSTFSTCNGTEIEMKEQGDKPLMDQVIDSVCDSPQIKDENVEIQVLKVLITAVTTVNCEIHGESLAKAVFTCIDVFLNTKNPVSKTTSQASLTQMLNLVFQRMARKSKGTEESIIQAA